MASDRIRRDSQEKIVILDTNAILMLFEFSIDLHAELRRLLGSYRVVVPVSVVQELTRLSKQGDGTRQRNGKAGLQYIRRYTQIDTEDVHGDDAVILVAKRLRGIVVTNDKQVRKELKEQHLPVIFLRKKQLLCLE